MYFNKEQQVLFDTGVELYELCESATLTGGNPFFAAARKQFYKSFLALIILSEEEIKEKITQAENIRTYEELLFSFSEEHLARIYYKGIQNLPPSTKSSVICDFKVTMREFISLFTEIVEKYQSNRSS
ncbi:hypothetical protein [Bacillus toyonensis]|uniref:hypothetical protein n=1 Tax=Bacillus toyonensis TaxID=155322 RepID=UPI001C0C9A76|nr:hypothetical protein [Bacillus toyonensis]MBU4643082.1 hypothetical protein [Bacillus toyonensis]